MATFNRKYIDLIEEIRLVEMALEDEEKKMMYFKDPQDKELSENKILDYEKHLKLLSKKLESFKGKLR